MNKKFMATMLLLSFTLASMFTSCSNETVETTAADETTTVATEETTEETKEEYNYVHGDTGYYSLVDEGYGPEIRQQVGGTCWVTSAASSMESSYKLRTGKTITIEPLDLLEAILRDDKSEGWFAPNVDKIDYGGWAWEIVETLSNGWDNYILMDATMYENGIDRKTLQEAIRNYGAMNVAINDNHGEIYARYFGNYFTMNDPDSESFDHSVVVVGWDDNFPKEYFAHKASQDGAWLCQNSSGEYWGKGGYYWVSYDTPFRENTVFIISDEYDHVTAYDWGNEDVVSTGEEKVTIANVFHDKGTLKAIGTDTTRLNQNIHIAICDAKMNKVIYEQDAFFPVNGYHTVILDEPIEVKDYSIVITYDESAPVEGESFDLGGVNYTVSCKKGESFIKVDGKWVDMSSENIKEILKIDFVPNNCCIKAIY